MHRLEELKEMLMEELEEFGARDRIDMQSLDIVDKLAHSVKNICKIMKEDCSEPKKEEDEFVRALKAMMKTLPESRKQETQKFIERIEEM